MLFVQALKPVIIDCSQRQVKYECSPYVGDSSSSFLVKKVFFK